MQISQDLIDKLKSPIQNLDEQEFGASEWDYLNP